MRWSISIAIAALLAGSIGLTGCSQAREALGLTKQSPDEFQVLAQAPLSMPPDYNLRPPQPGAPRPQEASARDQAAAAIFANTESGGATVDAASGGEAALLQNAGAAGVDPNIRQIVDAETKAEMEQDEQFIDRLVFWREPEPYGTVVDPQAEQQRLQENAALGRPVTEGETPVVIRKKRALLEGIF
jgi:hypothetical protein